LARRLAYPSGRTLPRRVDADNWNDAGGDAKRTLGSDMQMTISKTEGADFGQPDASRVNWTAAMRRCVRAAVVRYLRWRTVSQLQRLDAHTLRDLGLRPSEILSMMRGLEIDEMRRRSEFS
jgi:uncharacterized protein YjiS (DUF1127 family)